MKMYFYIVINNIYMIIVYIIMYLTFIYQNLSVEILLIPPFHLILSTVPFLFVIAIFPHISPVHQKRPPSPPKANLGPNEQVVILPSSSVIGLRMDMLASLDQWDVRSFQETMIQLFFYLLELIL